jgi:zinc and cadmium transporter
MFWSFVGRLAGSVHLATASAAVWIYVAVAVLLDGLAGVVGGLIPERWIATRRHLLVGFAAGVLIGVVFLDLLPDALAATTATVPLAIVLASFTAMALLEWWLGHHRSRHERGTPLPLMLLGADALHNLADGAAIAAAFLTSPRLGVVTSIAILVHEIPGELGDYAILRGAGLGRRRALIAMAKVQLTSGIGAAATLLGSAIWEKLSASVLAVAAGTFLYIGATDLLPDILHDRGRPGARRQPIAGLVCGLAAAVLVSLL